MRQDERDHMLLSILEPEDRDMLLALVDDIMEQDVPTPDAEHLHAAARSFERRGETLPSDQMVVAMQVAAALRLRASGGTKVH